MEEIIDVIQTLLPDSLNLDLAVRQLFEDIRQNSHSAVANAHAGHSVDKSEITFSFIWGCMMTAILFFFLVSCIQQFAQFYQTMLNGLESDRLRSLLSTRHLRTMSAGNLRRSPAAELLFSGSHRDSPVPRLGIMRAETSAHIAKSATKSFVQRIDSRKHPRYDLVYMSTAPAQG